MQNSNQDDKRRFSRVAFNVPVEVTGFTRSFHAKIIDLSLKGALIQVEASNHCEIDELVKLKIRLGEEDECIIMDVQVVYCNENKIGCVCKQIEIESMTTLRRIVELNLGSTHLLERELDRLVSDAKGSATKSTTE